MPVSRISFSTSMPSFSGMIMSSMSTSGSNAMKVSVASAELLIDRAFRPSCRAIISTTLVIPV